MATLRGPNGCNWDKKQSSDSLIPYLLEETYEVVDAIGNGDSNHLREELGDLLFNIFFQARIAEEQNLFDIEEVAREVADKLERRHPHVFAGPQDLPPEQVVQNWERIKEQEKKHQLPKPSILDEIPTALPSLLYAEKLQKKAAKQGFDWQDSDGPRQKFHEELAEFEQELQKGDGDSNRLEDEFGDILFSLVNLARFYQICPEKALRKTSQKFKNRFAYIETQAEKMAKPLNELTLAQMDKFWDEAKKKEPEQ